MKTLDDEIIRICKNVYKPNKHCKGFGSKNELALWWIDQLKIQNDCCDYCKTPIKLICELIDSKLLSGRKVKGDGVRGRQLELERIDSFADYSKSNCVLICYYCNNDKSNVYSAADYKTYLAPAKNKHFLFLQKKLAEIEKVNA